MPVKPLTLMGEGMLVTVGALMPGGVLPPAITETLTNIVFFVSFLVFLLSLPEDMMGKFGFDQLPSHENVRGAGLVDR